jgi:hypothetical protein
MTNGQPANIFRSIIAWFVSLFRRGPAPSEPVPPAPAPAPAPEPPPAPLTIPHPEEPPDYSKTMENTTVKGLLMAWFDGWEVPPQHQTWWRTEMNIMISLQYPNPAATSSETRQMWVRPEWANPGVIAHELAHVSYSLMSESMKTGFSADYTPLKTTDPLITLLYSQNTYGLTNDIEGHAEVYRYLGEKMPAQLKQYYPNLF